MYKLGQSDDIKEPFDNTISVMQGTYGDYTIPAISEFQIMDGFPYFSGEEGVTIDNVEFESIEQEVYSFQ